MGLLQEVVLNLARRQSGRKAHQRQIPKVSVCHSLLCPTHHRKVSEWGEKETEEEDLTKHSTILDPSKPFVRRI